MERLLIANWKMNLLSADVRNLVQSLISYHSSIPAPTKFVFSVPFPYLPLVNKMLPGKSNYFLGAQNAHEKESGAYTGEVAMPMLQDVGVSYVLLGHSERRTYFAENDNALALKMKAALQYALRPVLCVGESLETREKGTHLTFVAEQILAATALLTPDEAINIIIAYEPIWAIGTGKTATPEEVSIMHKHIRTTLHKKFASIADTIPILYGGSVQANNAATLFQVDNVNGALVGGASLKTDSANAILQALINK